MKKPQSSSGLWCFQSLLAPVSPNPSLFLVPNTILLENGRSAGHISTNRRGEVVRLRSKADAEDEKESIIRSFYQNLMRTSPNNLSSYVATLRHADGSLTTLNATAFEKLCQSWPPADPSIQAVQMYVNAGHGTVRRSTYVLKSTNNRSQVEHSSYLSIPASSEGEDSIKLSESGDFVLNPSKSSTMNDSIKNIVLSLVRKIESSRKILILKLTCDFILDAEDNLYLSWVDGVDYVSGEEVEGGLGGLGEYGVSEERNRRSSFLGKNPNVSFDAVDDNRNGKDNNKRSPSPPTRSRRARRGYKGGGEMPANSLRVTNDMLATMAGRVEELSPQKRREDMRLAFVRTNAEEVPVPVGSSELRAQRPTSPFQNVGIGAGRPVGLQLLNSEKAGEDNMTGKISSKTQKKNPFPSAMTCHGDFCTLQIRDAAQLNNERGTGGGTQRGHEELARQYEAISRLKKKQMNGLLRDANKISATDFAEIPYASIVRAREERKNADERAKGRVELLETAWQEYPSTPRENRKQFNLDDEYWKSLNSEGKNHDKNFNNNGRKKDRGFESKRVYTESTVKQDTEASKSRSEWAKTRGDVNVKGGTNAFYNNVLVCGECRRAYMLLDKARDLMQQDSLREERIEKTLSNGAVGDDGQAAKRRRSAVEANKRLMKASNMMDSRMEMQMQGSSLEMSDFPNNSSLGMSFEDSQVMNGGNNGEQPLFFPSPNKHMTFPNNGSTVGFRPMTSPTPKTTKQSSLGSRPMSSPVSQNGKRGKPPLQSRQHFQQNQDSIINEENSDLVFQDSVPRNNQQHLEQHKKNNSKLPRRRTANVVGADPASPTRPTWKARRKERKKYEDEFAARGEEPPPYDAFGGDFQKLDSFLRGTGEEFGNNNKWRAPELDNASQSNASQTNSIVSAAKNAHDNQLYVAKVLIAMNDLREAEPIAQMLKDQGYLVAFEQDGITVMEILEQVRERALSENVLGRIVDPAPRPRPKIKIPPLLPMY